MIMSVLTAPSSFQRNRKVDGNIYKKEESNLRRVEGGRDLDGRREEEEKSGGRIRYGGRQKRSPEGLENE